MYRVITLAGFTTPFTTFKLKTEFKGIPCLWDKSKDCYEDTETTKGENRLAKS